MANQPAFVRLLLWALLGAHWGRASVSCATSWLYDDSYLTDKLQDRFHYLRAAAKPGQPYRGPRDYFNFVHVFQPNESYLAGVNIERHLYDELRAMEFSSSIATMDQWNYSDPTELRLLAAPNSDPLECRRTLELLANEIRLADHDTERLFAPGLRNIQLLKYLDSFGRPVSETYYGHTYWVGSYRGCRAAELVEEPAKRITFHYCWAKLRAKSWPQKEEMRPPTSYRAGVCLPKSCDTHTANQHRSTILELLQFNFSPLHRQRFNRLIHVYCLPDAAAAQPTIAFQIYWCFVGLWLALVALASLTRATSGPTRVPGWLNCLSLQENFLQLCAADEPPAQGQRKVDLRPLNLVKLVACVLVCVGHVACVFGWVINSSSWAILENRRLLYAPFPSFMRAIDVFLVLTGLASAFTLKKRFASTRDLLRPSNYALLQLARYLRLAPLLVLLLAFMKSTYVRLGDGPNWDYGTHDYSIQGQCKQSSWLRQLVWPILLGWTGNSYASECLAVSWYPIVDLKLFLLLPPALYLLDRGRSGLLALAALVVVSTGWQYKDLWMQQLVYLEQFFTYGQLYAANILQLTFGEPAYFSPINRLYAFAIGLYAGIQLHGYQTASNSATAGRAAWPAWMMGWPFALMCAWEIVEFFSPLLAQYEYRASNGASLPTEETIRLAMVLKPRLSACIYAIVALRLVTDLSAATMRFTLALHKLSKLTYCVFLIHTIVISYVVSAHERSRLDSIFVQFLTLNSFVLSASFLLSAPLYLVFESPLALLLSRQLKGGRIRSARPAHLEPTKCD